jgi:cysteine-rich repeat protein
MKRVFFFAVIVSLIISCDGKKTIKDNDDLNFSGDSDEISDEAVTDDVNVDDLENSDDPFDSDEIIDDSDLVCGNGIIEGTEACDKDEKSCVELDAERYISGTAACSSDCTEYDTSTCVRSCTDGSTRCLVNVLQECIEKNWVDKEDCDDTELLCLPSPESSGYQRVYECRELGEDNSCAVILACYNACAEDEECIEACIASGTEAAQNFFDPLLECGVENCEGALSNTTCLREYCNTAYRACRNDPGVVCSNGFVEGSEECDDGNLSNMDGCSGECKIETAGTCNNGVIESLEQCEDGNLDNGDGCDEFCRFEYDDRFDFEGPEYSGDSLMILNSSPLSGNVSNSGAMPTVVLKNITVTPESSGTGLNDIFINPHFKIPEGLTNDDLYEPRVLLLPKVGDTQVFYVINGAGTEYNQVTATLLKIGTHVQIWSDDDSFATTEEINDIADEFDDVIYPLVTTNFAMPSDVNDDETITLLFTDLGLSIAGYFSPGDLYAKSMYPQSNERDMIFVSTRNALTNKGTYAVVAHEFQHLCYNNQNAIIEGDAMGINSNENIWINEGMSMTAMHLYNGIQSDWITAYNQSGSISSGQALTYWNDSDSNDVYGNYALSYLFFQYLRIQGDNKTEMFKEIVTDSVNDYRCVENAIRKYAGEGYNFSDFYTDFRISLLLNDSTGKFGFKGEPGFNLNKKYYNGTAAVDLRGTGTLIKQISTPFTEPVDKGALIKYIGITTE